MYDILTSVIAFALMALCALYVIKEMIRRRKRPEKFLEANNDIRVSILFWGMGVAAAVGYTIGYYTCWSQNTDVLNYLLMCLISLVFVFLAFIMASKKIIINTETGDMVACSLLGKKKFNVVDITLIKYTWDAWVTYSGKRKLFVVRDRYNNQSNGFYAYIRRESGCQELPRKGYASRENFIEVKVINSAIAIRRNPIIPTEFKYKLLEKLGERYTVKDKEKDQEISGKVEKIKLTDSEMEKCLDFYRQNNFKYSFEEYLECKSFPIDTLELFSMEDNTKIALVDFVPDGDVNLVWIDVYNANYKNSLVGLINSLIYD